MSFFYVPAAIAATLIIVDGWRSGVRSLGLPFLAILLLAGCNAGGLLVVEDGGTGGGETTATDTVTIDECSGQDPNCPASFPHAYTCTFYDGGPCQFGQCI